MLIDTPLLVIGRGPAALVAAKVAAGRGLACLLAGHEPLGGEDPEPLAPAAAAALVEHGVIDILRPYLVAVDPPTIAPAAFEEVLKHHCVADVNVTVYDRVEVVERVPTGRGVRAVLTDGTSRWDLSADSMIDATPMPTDLSGAVLAGVAAAGEALDGSR